MQSNWGSTGEKLHKRNIEVTTYDYDGQRIIVEGLLRDDYFHESYMPTGSTIPSGVTHHMAIRLLVNCSNLLIEDCDVDLISVPREECWETRECLAFIKGLTITKGFTLKIKKMAGGNKGCAHLVELLMAMSPAIFQGFVAHQTRKPLVFDSDQSQKENEKPYFACTARCPMDDIFSDIVQPDVSIGARRCRDTRHKRVENGRIPFHNKHGHCVGHIGLAT